MRREIYIIKGEEFSRTHFKRLQYTRIVTKELYGIDSFGVHSSRVNLAISMDGELGNVTDCLHLIGR